MQSAFSGAELRLARVYNDMSLEEVARHVDKTRQYLHKLETGQAMPTSELIEQLAQTLRVKPAFFAGGGALAIADEQFHFRKLFTTRSMVKQVAMAKAEIFGRLVTYLDRELKLPPLRIPTIKDACGSDDVERAAEVCRSEWGLGLGPIAHMTRLAENVGTVVTSFQSTSQEIDALSVMLHRPVIVRNDAKESPCRQRFDIGHELGHCVLHQGRITGDRITESEANRFAGALLVPRSMMVKLFPRPRGSRLDWRGIGEFKLTWKVSKAALLYRARQLGLIDDGQYKTGVITLNRTGEAIREKEDHLIPAEPPELLHKSIEVLRTKKETPLAGIAASLCVHADLLAELVGEVGDRQPHLRPVGQTTSRPRLKLVAGKR